MEFRVLEDEQSLTAFSILTEKHISVRFPLEYLKKSKVVALLNKRKEICGGYVLVLKPPFRVIDSLPDEIIKDNVLINKSNLEKAFELTGLWLSPDISGRIVAFRFWTRMYFDIFSIRKKHMVFAYNLNKPVLGKIYSIVSPKILFRGITKIQPGMKKQEEESVELANVYRIALVPILKPHFFCKKTHTQTNFGEQYRIPTDVERL